MLYVEADVQRPEDKQSARANERELTADNALRSILAKQVCPRPDKRQTRIAAGTGKLCWTTK